MLSFDSFVNVFLSALLAPLQIVLTPIDALLNQIQGIQVIPNSISAIGQFVGTIPQTLVVISGINPVIWNALFSVFVLYIGLAPTIQGLKKVWAWIRP